MTTPSPSYTPKCELLFSDFLPVDRQGQISSLLLESYRSLLSTQLPVALSVRVMRTGKQLEQMWELYLEARKRLLEENVVRDDAGEMVPGSEPNTVQLKDPALFGKQMMELLEQPAGTTRRLDVDELIASNITLMPSTLFALEPLLTAEAPEATPDENN